MLHVLYSSKFKQHKLYSCSIPTVFTLPLFIKIKCEPPITPKNWFSLQFSIKIVLNISEKRLNLRKKVCRPLVSSRITANCVSYPASSP